MKLVALFILGIFAQNVFAQTVPQSVTLDIASAVALLFNVPASSVLTQAFTAAFVTPMSVYLVAYLVGILVNFWSK